jgi:hypothetical protein
MLTGTIVSRRENDNARIWTLTLPREPRYGELLIWSEPACGSIPAQTGVRGWLIDQESTRPGTQILIEAGRGTRWVEIVVSVFTTNVTCTLCASPGCDGTRHNANPVDQVITDVTVAASDTDAISILRNVPSAILMRVADQLYIDADGRSFSYIRKAIVAEARS